MKILKIIGVEIGLYGFLILLFFVGKFTEVWRVTEGMLMDSTCQVILVVIPITIIPVTYFFWHCFSSGKRWYKW